MTSTKSTPGPRILNVETQQQQQQPSQEKKTDPTAVSFNIRSPTHGLPYDAETMQYQMEHMIREGIYDSAQLLGEFLIALATTPPIHPTNMNENNPSHVFPQEFHATSFRLFADLLMKRCEYKRAIQYYKLYWKIQMPSSVDAQAVEVKVNIAKCWIQLENIHQAIEVLHSIAIPSRTLSVHLLLGKLYLGEGLKHKAEESYRTALQQNPYALEAALALADLASTQETVSTNNSDSLKMEATSQLEIERFYAKLSTMRSSRIKLISRVDATWLQILVNGHIHAKRGRYQSAKEAFDKIDQLFPNNLHCLLHIGLLEMERDAFQNAQVCFFRARQMDEYNIQCMDMYANCLRHTHAKVQLNRLVHDLFEVSENHVEPWLAAAYYAELKRELENALQYCERAILTDRRCSGAHLLRGVLLLQLQRPEHALVAFSTACKLSKSLEALGGMVMSYCDLCVKGINKYKEALTTAKAAVNLFPQRAHSFTLLGNVFALRAEHTEQAKKAFERALILEPRKLAAVFGLVDLLIRDGNMRMAIDKLLQLSERNPREEVFTKLADLYTLDKQFGEAMTWYHRALSIHPSSIEANNGIERLEKIMRGEDPDEKNTTMEQMESEEHEQSMEIGEYGT